MRQTAPSIDPSIRNRLIRRLLAVAAVFAALSGTAAFFYEMEQVDDLVVSRAVEESHGMMEHVAFLNIRDPEDFEIVRRQVEQRLQDDHIVKGPFIAVELYDRKKQKVISVFNPEDERIVQSLDERKSVPLNDGIAYRKFTFDSLLYVQVSVPLTYAAGEVVGYFKGVYRTEPATMHAIRRRLLWSVLQVIIIVFLTTLAVYPVILALNRDMIQLQDDLTSANVGMLELLGNAVAKRDSDTNSHNYRVTIYAIRLAEAGGMERLAVQGLIKGAFLHDIGKIGISDTILHKPSSLSPQEKSVMETHVQHGVDILGRYAWLKDAMEVVRYHHEKFDGSGYPQGLKGRIIPLSARIFAIVDVFDALTSKRPYKEAASIEQTLEIMKEERGTRFDPELFDVFLRIAPGLHRDVCLADDAKLIKLLSMHQAKYFTIA
jgi:putative nucleotidyltransferase with HDIG domain